MGGLSLSKPTEDRSPGLRRGIQLLRVLSDGEPRTATSLREALNISQATLARTIAALEEEGFLMERTGANIRWLSPLPIPQPATDGYVPPLWPGKAQGEPWIPLKERE